MRGGKRGQHKGRERVLAENEDDIIARNMMVRFSPELSRIGERGEEEEKRLGRGGFRRERVFLRSQRVGVGA